MSEVARFEPLDDEVDDPRGEAMYRAVLSGLSPSAVAKQFKGTRQEVEAAYDRHLPRLDARALARLKREQVARIQELQEVHQAEALQQKNYQAALVSLRCSERLSELTGIDAPRAQAVN